MRSIFIYISRVVFVTIAACYAQKLTIGEYLLKDAILLTSDNKLASEAMSGNVKALYEIAKNHLDVTKTSSGVLDETALKILHALADHATDPYISSQVTLGFAYYEVNDRVKSLHYFERAGQLGPHQAALYNAGRIHAENSNWIPALAYMQASITLQSTHESLTNPKLTQTCIEAYEILSENLAILEGKQQLTIEQIADLFLVASQDDFPNNQSEALELWTSASILLQNFNRSFYNSGIVHIDYLDGAAGNLRRLWEIHSSSMSKLQVHLLLKTINRALAILTSTDDIYLEASGGYAEALAVSPYCSHLVASDIKNGNSLKCFNQAMSDAMSYYRRASEYTGGARVFNAAKQHPTAATSWRTIDQTPTIFIATKSKSKPWYKLDNFPSVNEAQVSARKASTALLPKITSLPDDQPYCASFGLPHTETIEFAELSRSGNIKQSSQNVGFRPTFSSTVRSSSPDVFGRAEVVLLNSDGSKNTKTCSQMPQLCDAVYDAIPDANTIKIIRLKPGTQILPHCAGSNNDLMVFFFLEGCQGVDTMVGGIKSSDLHKDEIDRKNIIFDNSYEHSITNNGPSICYYLSWTFNKERFNA